MSILAESFGAEVRSIRKARRLTQAVLADRSGLSEEWVRRIERGAGAPSFDAIGAIASALNVPVSALFARMSEREQRAVKLDAILGDMSDDEFAWIEDVIRAVLRPSRTAR